MSGRGDILAVIESALRDAGPLMRSRKVYLTLAVLCALLVGAALALANALDPPSQLQLRENAFSSAIGICMGIAAFFVMPAVARTVRPEFRLTVSGAFVLLLIAFVTGIGTEIGLVLLVLPGLWFGIKTSQATWTYLLSDGENPIAESWRLTTGRFWETFCLFFLLWVVMVLIDLVVVAVPVVVSVLVPLAGIVLAPLAFLGMVYVYHILCLTNMRWMLELRKLPHGSEAMAATVSA